MIDRAALLADCKQQVRALEDDLRERATDPDAGFSAALHADWHDAATRERIAATYETWLDGQITQVAVAWVLATVLLRFAEDNGLIDEPYLSGPGDRAAIATERQEAYFATVEHRHETDREWIRAGIDALSGAARGTPIVAGLFDSTRNPMWRVMPSPEAAKGLIAFWRRRGESGDIAHDFADSELETNFLGDLYQGLSEQARKQYALLQTPRFVASFILQYTLDLAIKEFGLEPENEIGEPGLRIIDPACGSGHFLLGAFERLANEWEGRSSDLTLDQRVARALESVHGVDKNPFAVSIARFRLLVAALHRLGIRRLADFKRDAVINVAVGDSLLHGRGAPGVQESLFSERHHFATEDVIEFQRSCDILGAGSYHVVVGNPPYITPKDPQENKNYREAYASCSGQYALSVPFAERMFKLARVPDADGRGSGFVGQITANSFMKREFGKKLIEEFLSQKVNLTYVIDTSGAYIPGHGTPTVILIGRRGIPFERQTVRAVLGVRGEPAQPAEPEKGLVWQAIVNQVDHPGSESDWVSVVDLDRAMLRKYPWSLSGGGIAELVGAVEEVPCRMGNALDVVGRTTHTGLDEAFYMPAHSAKTRHLGAAVVPIVLGDDVREFVVCPGVVTLFPYDSKGVRRDISSQETMAYWPLREALRRRMDFGRKPEERGLRWFDHSMFFAKRFVAPYSIPFAFVATHNHFVLDRGGKVFNRSAPVIKLPEGASEDEHLALLGVLNSSTACFWLKQVSHGKGNGGVNEGYRGDEWEEFFEFTGTKLEDFPFPADLPTGRARVLDQLAREWIPLQPGAVCDEQTPTRERLDAARDEYSRIRGRMIALQEELDWDVYRRYRLISTGDADELVAEPVDVPELKLGERAFEIVLARSGAETQWFRATSILAHHQRSRALAGGVPVRGGGADPGDRGAQAGHRVDRAAGVQAALAGRAVGENGNGRAACLVTGSVCGPQAVVRRGRAAAGADREPAGGSAARRRRDGVGGSAVCRYGRGPGHGVGRDRRGRACALPGRLPVQGFGPA